MKNSVLVVLILAVTTAVVFCVEQRIQLRRQSAQASQAQTRVSALETQLNQQGDAIEHAKMSEAKNKILQQTLTEASADAAQRSKQATAFHQFEVTWRQMQTTAWKMTSQMVPPRSP